MLVRALAVSKAAWILCGGLVCLAGAALSLFTLILMSFSADAFVARICAVFTVASSTVTAAVALQMVLSSLLLVSMLLLLKGTVATLVYDIVTYDSALWLKVYRSALNLQELVPDCVSSLVCCCASPLPMRCIWSEKTKTPTQRVLLS